MVCRVLAEHGLLWQDGTHDPMQSGRGSAAASYRTYEHPRIKRALKDLAGGYWPLGNMVEEFSKMDAIRLAGNFGNVDFFKAGVELYQVIKACTDHHSIPLNIIRVYRPAEQVARSIERRGIGAYDVALEVTLKRYRLMDRLPGVSVDTERLANMDWNGSGIISAVNSCGIEWDHLSALSAIDSKKFHTSPEGGYE